MGFPLEYWETDYIQDAICSFGRLENWVNNRRRLTRLLVGATVADLQSIPQWIVYSDGVGHQLESWTVQMQIVSHDFIGGGPPPEDHPPHPHQYNHLAPFGFYGLGQPGVGPQPGAGPVKNPQGPQQILNNLANQQVNHQQHVNQPQQ